MGTNFASLILSGFNILTYHCLLIIAIAHLVIFLQKQIRTSMKKCGVGVLGSFSYESLIILLCRVKSVSQSHLVFQRPHLVFQRPFSAGGRLYPAEDIFYYHFIAYILFMTVLTAHRNVLSICRLIDG